MWLEEPLDSGCSLAVCADRGRAPERVAVAVLSGRRDRARARKLPMGSGVATVHFGTGTLAAPRTTRLPEGQMSPGAPGVKYGGGLEPELAEQGDPLDVVRRWDSPVTGGDTGHRG